MVPLNYISAIPVGMTILSGLNLRFGKIEERSKGYFEGSGGPPCGVVLASSVFNHNHRFLFLRVTLCFVLLDLRNIEDTAVYNKK